MDSGSHRLYYSVTGASSLLGISRAKAYRLISSGCLSAKKIGPRLLRIPKEELERFISERDEFFSNYFSRAEAARRLRVTQATIDNWVYEGYLESYKFASFPLGVLKTDVFEIDPGAKQAA